MNLEGIMKSVSHRRIDTVGLHITEVPQVAKFRESGMMVAMGQGDEEMGNYHL